MAYSKTNWANNTTPAISAANLNKMEQGIFDAHSDIANVNTELTKDANSFSALSDNYGKNLYNELDVNTTVYGKLLNSSGELIDNADYKVIGFIPVEGSAAGTYYYISWVGIDANKMVRIAQYDSNKSLVNASTAIYANQQYIKWKVGSSPKFIKVSIPKNFSNIQVEVGESGTPYEPGYTAKDNYSRSFATEIINARTDFEDNTYSDVGTHLRTQESKIDTIIQNITGQYGKNLFDLLDKSQIIDGKALNSSGTLIDDANSHVIGYFPVVGTPSGENHSISWVGTEANKIVRIAKYDSTKTLIDASTAAYATGDHITFKITSSTSFVRISIPKSLTNVQFERGSVSNYEVGYSARDEKTRDFAIQWKNKIWGAYGDSITQISDGDSLTTGWARYVNERFMFSAFFGRGIGSQGFKWGTGGGSVTFIDSDGICQGRNDNYNKDNYTGTVPTGTTKCRGCFCSWDRITHQFPASIKDTIDMVFIMGGTNDGYDSNEPEFVENDTTDIEWATSDEYATFGGDYNISTLAGAVASTIMKFQAWMPNALIVIGTPLSGEGVSGQVRTSLGTGNYPKALKIKEIAGMTSCPCIDVYEISGISPFNRLTYISDAVHPYLEEGKMMLARAIISGLKDIFPKMPTY